MHAKVLQTWFQMLLPFNQRFHRVWAAGMHIDDAYNEGLKLILQDPYLSTFKYLLTIEEDNAIPPDGLVKLYESMNLYDVVGGLYWEKAEDGFPMIFGNPAEPTTYHPQSPMDNTVCPCNGLGMGFTLYKMSIFKDPRLPSPLFQTITDFDPSTNATRRCTQDAFFFKHIRKLGYVCAVDCRVKVGHYDASLDKMW